MLVAVYQYWPPLLSNCLVLVHEQHFCGPVKQSYVDKLCMKAQLVCMEMKSLLNVAKCMNMVMGTKEKSMNSLTMLTNQSIIVKAVCPNTFCSIGKGICIISTSFKCIVFP